MLPAAFPRPEQGTSDGAASPSAASNKALRPENFWQNFRFEVRQHGKIISTRSIHNVPVYSAATKDSPSTLDGALVTLEYDTQDLASEETRLDIVTPDARTISSVFDLQKLR